MNRNLPVVLNVARGQQRRSKLADRLRGTVRIIQTQEVVADDVPDVRAALNSLDPDLAELVRLVHWEGFNLAEAAHVMGLPASTARSRYGRAKRELSVLLASHQHVNS